jgi:hypothetical protein
MLIVPGRSRVGALPGVAAGAAWRLAVLAAPAAG